MSSPLRNLKDSDVSFLLFPPFPGIYRPDFVFNQVRMDDKQTLTVTINTLIKYGELREQIFNTFDPDVTNSSSNNVDWVSLFKWLINRLNGDRKRDRKGT